MNRDHIISAIDNEISVLKQVRELISPQTAVNKHISAAGRARIAAAQKKRWADYKKAKRAA